MSKRPQEGYFGGVCSLDGVIVKVSRRFNLFWIPYDWGYSLGPPGGLTDPIRNVRKTPRKVILEEMAVLVVLVSSDQGDSTCCCSP